MYCFQTTVKLKNLGQTIISQGVEHLNIRPWRDFRYSLLLCYFSLETNRLRELSAFPKVEKKINSQMGMKSQISQLFPSCTLSIPLEPAPAHHLGPTPWRFSSLPSSFLHRLGDFMILNSSFPAVPPLPLPPHHWNSSGAKTELQILFLTHSDLCELAGAEMC